MIKQQAIALISGLMLAGCNTATTGTPHPEPCSSEWYPWVESVISSGDGRGHGPDTGSAEWQSVIEFKLGIRDQADIPPRSSKAWCDFIDQRITDTLASRPIKGTVKTNSHSQSGESP